MSTAQRKHEESDLLKAIHHGVNASGIAMLFRNNSGRAKFGVHFVQYGLGVGGADLVGLRIAPGTPQHGRGVAIEVKSATGTVLPSQVAWRGAWERAGGIYVLARSVQEAIDGIVF